YRARAGSDALSAGVSSATGNSALHVQVATTNKAARAGPSSAASLTIDRPSLVLERSEDRPPLRPLRRLDVPDGVRDRGEAVSRSAVLWIMAKRAFTRSRSAVNPAELATRRSGATSGSASSRRDRRERCRRARGPRRPRRRPSRARTGSGRTTEQRRSRRVAALARRRAGPGARRRLRG